MDEEEQIAEVIYLSLESIQLGFDKVKEGIQTQDKDLIKAGFHLMRPNLVHIELAAFKDEFPLSDQGDFFIRSQHLIDLLEPKVDEVKRIASKMKYRVQIIEDDKSYQKIISTLVESDERLEIISVEDNSLSAAMSIVRNKPDILLLDIEISGLNGLEVLETLDHMPCTVVISSKIEFRKEIANTDIVGFIAKPIESKAIFREEIDKCIALLDKR